MPATTYLPSREADLLNWSTNFNTLISAAPTDYGLDAAQATAYTALHATFLAAYQTAIQNSTRTPSAIEAKDDAKEALLDGPGGIRELVAIIQATPGVTNQQRSDLQITVRDGEPTPVPVPKTAPIINIVGTSGTYVTINLRNAESPESRAKPFGVAAAAVLTAFGPVAPDLSDKSAWTWQGNVTNPTDVTLEFPGEPSGTTVWITSVWQNTRGETGPPTQPISAQIPGQASGVSGAQSQSPTLTLSDDEGLQEAA